MQVRLLTASLIFFGLITSAAAASERVAVKMVSGRSVSALSTAASLKPLFNATNRALAARIGLDRWYVATGSSAPEMLKALRAHSAVERADPVSAVHLATEPNDPLFPSQWALRNTGSSGGIAGADIRAVSAWDITTGSPLVTVAVVDTGIDPNHPDLIGHLVPGYNFVANTTDTTDDHGHGTSCAGIVGSGGNNAILTTGVTWNCKLMPVKVIASNGNGEDIWLAQGVTWATDHGAKVISISLVVSEDATALHEAVDYAIASGVVVVAAMGNDAIERVRYPAGMPAVIAVGATNKSDLREWFSTWGSHIDVVAPGADILTSARGGGTTGFSGTSAATPHVAGLCALVLSLDPTVTPDRMQTLVCQGSDDLPPYGFDSYTGYGRINAYATLLAAQDSTPPSNPFVTDTGMYTDDPTQISFNWTTSTDLETGVLGYEYAIGTTSQPTSVRNWTALGNVTWTTVTGLSLTANQSYIVSLRAVNGAHLKSGTTVTDGIIHAPLSPTVGSALRQPNDQCITLAAKVVSAGFSDRTWICEQDRSAAIAVQGYTGASEGDVVTVAGRLSVSGCLRTLTVPEVKIISNLDVPPALHMTQGALGGTSPTADTPEITGGVGLYNVGNTVRMTGKVASSHASWFLVLDGSGVSSYLGEGVKVLTNGSPPPGDGSTVDVTGIVECETHAGATRPVVRIRKPSDIVLLD